MKKLMMAVAIVCAAAGVQAASIAWTVTPNRLTDANGAILNTKDAIANIYLVNLGSSIDWTKATIIEKADAETLGKTTMTIGTAATTSSKSGVLSGKVKFDYDSASGSNLIDNGDYLALMFKDADGNLSQLTYTSGSDKGELVGAAWKVEGLVNDGTGLSGKNLGMTGNFTAAAVPEPTSAMLLVLGLGALALRRGRCS